MWDLRAGVGQGKVQSTGEEGPPVSGACSGVPKSAPVILSIYKPFKGSAGRESAPAPGRVGAGWGCEKVA
jgi:hypothetical protein